MFGILGRNVQIVRPFMIVQANHTAGYGAWGKGNITCWKEEGRGRGEGR